MADDEHPAGAAPSLAPASSSESSAVQPQGLSGLPGEILLHIISFLEPYDITQVQLASRAFRSFCRDNQIWKWRCFEESPFLQLLRRRRSLALYAVRHTIHDQITSSNGGVPRPEPTTGPDLLTRAHSQRRRDLANWDPVYPGEKVSWYEEYIRRYGNISVSWLQQPRGAQGYDRFGMDVRGTALYRPSGTQDLLAVSPLDDGSVCLWDINGSRGRKGAVVSRSASDILFIDGPGSQNTRRSKRIDTGVTECVSVNSASNRAFFAVQCHLIEVDLNRLEVVGHESFPWSITTLSTAQHGVPLSIGTTLGLHLYDFRARLRPHDDASERLDANTGKHHTDPLRGLFDPQPLNSYAPLSQPTPLSILHPTLQGSQDLVSDDIYVAGRFTSILRYDRRKFPSIMGSIHSGARLSSLAYLPQPLSIADADKRRIGLLTVQEAEESKKRISGQTLIAAGEYGTKGSLELYPLRGPAGASTRTSSPAASPSQGMQNRQSAAGSRILSVANQGTCIVFSDSSGNIKWFERDGFTEVRRHRIGHSEVSNGPSIFASMPGSDDLARKIIPIDGCSTSGVAGNNDILFWTGEKLGLLSFSRRSFTAEDFEVQGRGSGANGAQGEGEEEEEEERRRYTEAMSAAFERQADEVRFVQNLGLGTQR